MASAGRKTQEFMKLTKVERKAFKKQARKLCSFLKDRSDIETSENPTKHLLVGNGGLVCGVNRSKLLTVFEPHGNITSVEMIPGKSYSFISFNTVADAESAYKAIQGQLITFPNAEGQEDKAITFYLAFVKKLNLENDPIDSTSLPLFINDSFLFPAGLSLHYEYITKEKEIELIRYFTDGETGDTDGYEDILVIKSKVTLSNGALTHSDVIRYDGWLRMKEDLADDLVTDGCDRRLKHRKVKHFGFEFLYGTNNIDKSNPLKEGIPTICNDIIDEMVKDNRIPWKPDQLTINEYEPGQGIPPHIDTHSAFEDGIISLSLGSEVLMDFRHPDGKRIAIVLPPRSLLIMKGESRYLWTHGITPRKYDIIKDTRSDQSDALTLLERSLRISLTFRKIRHIACDCQYSSKCDSRDSEPVKENQSDIKEDLYIPQNENEAKDLEVRHVHDIYEKIAEHFSDTRHSPWPRVAKFLKRLPAGSFVADIGCGNGKYLGINQSILSFGSDRSSNLLQICRDRGHCVTVADILSLPYRSNSFDACICIAVIHHLSTDRRRTRAIKEVISIVKPGGYILISVWALEQENATSTKGCSTSSLGKNKTENTADNVKVPVDVAIEEVLHCPVSQDKNLDSSRSEFQYEANLSSNSNITSKIQSGEDINTTQGSKILADLTVQDSRHILDKREEENLNGKVRTKITLNEKRNVFEQQDLLVPWHYRGSEKKKHRRNVDDSDMQDDTLDCMKCTSDREEKTYQRFYHVFREGELEDICQNIGNVNLMESYYDRGNWCVILEKSH